jgi:nitrite reductase (NADH) small subunit/3-phenylpropionate/trans-cinnamate dioxygenase ferredoxin subunit
MCAELGRAVNDDFETAAQVADVPPGTGKAVNVGEREIALFNVDGCFYALDNNCPHQGGPLAEGWVDGTEVTCPWHAWTFKLTDGKMTLGDFASVDTFAVTVDGTDVRVSRTPNVPLET